MAFMWSPKHAHMIRDFVHCTLEMLEVHTQTPGFFSQVKNSYLLFIKNQNNYKHTNMGCHHIKTNMCPKIVNVLP